MSQTYNVLIATELKGISEDAEKEIDMRLEEHGLEKVFLAVRICYLVNSG